MSQDKSSFGLDSFLSISNAQKRAKSMLGKEEPEQKEIITPNTESIIREEIKTDAEPQAASVPIEENKEPIRSAEELQKIIEEQQAKIDALMKEQRPEKKESVQPVIRDSQEQNICIRMNTLRKRYCKQRAKEIGAEGGIAAYINFLVALDMREHQALVKECELWAGRDIPYVSVPASKRIEEVFDEKSAVDKATSRKK